MPRAITILRAILSFVCFLIGLVAFAGGLMMAFFTLGAIGSIEHPRPFSDTLTDAVPGIIAAACGIAFMLLSRKLDDTGPVRRGTKGRVNTRIP